MTSRGAAGLKTVLKDGYGAVLAPAGFEHTQDLRRWRRVADGIEHLVTVRKVGLKYRAQWGPGRNLRLPCCGLHLSR